jgi:hypothetical protein
MLNRQSNQHSNGDIMQKTSLLLIMVGGILSACIAYESAPRSNIGTSGGQSAGISYGPAGAFCSARLAMKGYC